MNQLVVGFNVENNTKSELDNLSDNEKHKLYDAGMSYSLSNFFNLLNADLIDTENYYWYVITI